MLNNSGYEVLLVGPVQTTLCPAGNHMSQRYNRQEEIQRSTSYPGRTLPLEPYRDQSDLPGFVGSAHQAERLGLLPENSVILPGPVTLDTPLVERDLVAVADTFFLPVPLPVEIGRAHV